MTERQCEGVQLSLVLAARASVLCAVQNAAPVGVNEGGIFITGCHVAALY